MTHNYLVTVHKIGSIGACGSMEGVRMVNWWARRRTSTAATDGRRTGCRRPGRRGEMVAERRWAHECILKIDEPERLNPISSCLPRLQESGHILPQIPTDTHTLDLN
jgi:hypothetical protein